MESLSRINRTGARGDSGGQAERDNEPCLVGGHHLDASTDAKAAEEQRRAEAKYDQETLQRRCRVPIIDRVAMPPVRWGPREKGGDGPWAWFVSEDEYCKASSEWSVAARLSRSDFEPSAELPSDAQGDVLNNFPFWTHSGLSEDARALHAWLHRLQHPEDCLTAPLLVAPSWWSGFGSDLHGFGNRLMLAAAMNRTMVYEHQWHFADKERCPELSPACYWRIGSCRAEHAQPGDVLWEARTKERVTAVRFEHRLNTGPDGINTIYPQNIKRVPAVLQPAVAARGFYWYRSHVQLFLARPTPPVAKLVASVKADLGIRHPVVGMHVRQGDKGKEAFLLGLSEYMTKMEAVLGPQRPRTIFLATESSDILEATKQYPEYKWLYTTGHHRGLKTGVEATSQIWLLDHHHLSPTTEAMVAIVNAYLLAECDYFVGTMSSNFGRLVTELMIGRRDGEHKQRPDPPSDNSYPPYIIPVDVYLLKKDNGIE